MSIHGTSLFHSLCPSHDLCVAVRAIHEARRCLHHSLQAMRLPSMRHVLLALWAHAQATHELAGRLEKAQVMLRSRRGFFGFKSFQLKTRMDRIWWHTTRPNAMRKVTAFYHRWTAFCIARSNARRQNALDHASACVTLRHRQLIELARRWARWREELHVQRQLKRLRRWTSSVRMSSAFLASAKKSETLLQAATLIHRSNLRFSFERWEAARDASAFRRRCQAAADSQRQWRVFRTWLRRMQLHDELTTVYQAGEERGLGERLAQVEAVRFALVDSASKSQMLLSRYAEFRGQYEHERHEMQRHSAVTQSDIALLTSKLLDAQQQNERLQEEVLRLAEEAHTARRSAAEQSDLVLERCHDLALELTLPPPEPPPPRTRTVRTQTPPLKERKWLPLGM